MTMFKQILRKWSSSSLMLYWKACEPEAIKDYYFVPYPNCKLHEIRYMERDFKGKYIPHDSINTYDKLMRLIDRGIVVIK